MKKNKIQKIVENVRFSWYSTNEILELAKQQTEYIVECNALNETLAKTLYDIAASTVKRFVKSHRFAKTTDVDKILWRADRAVTMYLAEIA